MVCLFDCMLVVFVCGSCACVLVCVCAVICVLCALFVIDCAMASGLLFVVCAFAYLFSVCRLFVFVVVFCKSVFVSFV